MKRKSFPLIIILLNLSIFNFYFISFNDFNNNIIKNFSPDFSTTDSWNRTWDWGGYVNGLGIDSLNNVIITTSYGISTFKVIKMNSSGEELWNTIYDRWTYGYEDWFTTDLTIDSLDNIVIVGYQENWWSTLRYDYLVAKFNRSGNKIWDIIWYNEVETLASSVAVDSVDNIYIGVQKVNSEGIVLVKYDTAGNQVWNTSWGGVHNEVVSEIAVDSSDNIYLTGYEEGYEGGDYDIFLLKYNSSGALQWNQTWSSNHRDYSSDIFIDFSDNIFISGSSYSCCDSFSWGDGKSYLMKVNNSGYLQWNKTLGNNFYWKMAKDKFGNIYTAGFDEIYPGEREDICLVKFNQSETIEWEIFWGGKGRETAYNLALDSNNNIYIAGSLDNRPLLIKNPNNKTVIIEPPSDEFFISFGIYFLFYTLIGIICITIVMRKKQEIDLE